MGNWAFQNMTKTFTQEKPPYLRLSHIQHRITESFSATAQEIDFFFPFKFLGKCKSPTENRNRGNRRVQWRFKLCNNVNHITPHPQWVVLWGYVYTHKTYWFSILSMKRFEQPDILIWHRKNYVKTCVTWILAFQLTADLHLIFFFFCFQVTNTISYKLECTEILNSGHRSSSFRSSHSPCFRLSRPFLLICTSSLIFFIQFSSP